MRWLFYSVCVLTAGAVAAYAIHVFGGSSGSASERQQALAAAHEIAGACVTGAAGATCHAADVTRLAPRLWRTRIVSGKLSFCVNIHLDQYQPRATTINELPGVAVVDCPRG